MLLHFLVYLGTYFLYIFGLVWRNRKDKVSVLLRLVTFVKLVVWPPAWVRHLDMMVLGQARAIVARKESMEKETRVLEKKERKETHHKGFKKASALRRRQALKRGLPPLGRPHIETEAKARESFADACAQNKEDREGSEKDFI